MSHKALYISFLCLCPRDTNSFLTPFEHGKVKMLAWTLSTLQAARTKAARSEGVLHHVENCVQSHCRKQQVAVKGRSGPHCDCLGCRWKVTLQARLWPLTFLLRVSQGKLIRFMALSSANIFILSALFLQQNSLIGKKKTSSLMRGKSAFGFSLTVFTKKWKWLDTYR